MTNRLPRIIVGTLLGHVAATMALAVEIDFGGLPAEMLDRARIVEFPDPAFVCKRASSFKT